MKVLAPSVTIIRTKTKALRRPYIRSSDGAISGARAGLDGIATMPLPSVTRAMPRRTIAVVCAVRHSTPTISATVSDETMVPAIRQLRSVPEVAPARIAAPNVAPASSAPPIASAATMPNVVGRRCVLMRTSDLPPPCSSTSARTSSHAQRPTKTLTSRSSDQPSSISIDRTARERRSHSVSCASTRSADVQVSLQKRSSVTLPEISSSARHASASDGRGPRLVCGSPGGSATSGGDSTPRIRPRMRASGWMKWR